MAQEIASQIALRNCSKEVGRPSIHIHTYIYIYILGVGWGWEIHLVKHKILLLVTKASLVAQW